MITDNGMVFLPYMKNKKASFISTIYGGKRIYIAANRAARRFLRSKRVKSLGLEMDLETESIS